MAVTVGAGLAAAGVGTFLGRKKGREEKEARKEVERETARASAVLASQPDPLKAAGEAARRARLARDAAARGRAAGGRRGGTLLTTPLGAAPAELGRKTLLGT